VKILSSKISLGINFSGASPLVAVE